MLIVEVVCIREGLLKRSNLKSARSMHSLSTYCKTWVDVLNITLGVTGTIYTDALATMASIGIPASAITRYTCLGPHDAQAHERPGYALLELDSHHDNKAFQRPP